MTDGWVSWKFGSEFGSELVGVRDLLAVPYDLNKMGR